MKTKSVQRICSILFQILRKFPESFQVMKAQKSTRKVSWKYVLNNIFSFEESRLNFKFYKVTTPTQYILKSYS